MMLKRSSDISEPAGLPHSPLVKPVIERLSMLIRDGRMRPGDRLPSIRALAQEQGVSFTTARAAVTWLERQGLLQSFHGSGTYVRGYDPVEERGRPKADTVYLFLDRRPHVTGELGNRIANLLKEQRIPTISHGGWGAPNHPSQMRFVEDFKRRPPRAIVLHHVDRPRDEMIRAACGSHSRVITSFRTGLWEQPGWHAVNPDYFTAFKLAARYAIAQGHTRVGIVAKSRTMQRDWMHTRRRSWMLETQQILGAGAALREAGRTHRLTIHYNLVDSGLDPSGIPISEANVARMTDWLKSPDRPTAVVGDDYRMLGLRRAAKRAGLTVGKDLFIVGVGCSVLTFGVGFPCVDLRMPDVAEQTVQLILADDRDLGSNARHVNVRPRLLDGDGEPIEGFDL